MKKLLPYLILNVLVSAITMLVVLVIWNTAHPVQKQTLPQSLPSQETIITNPIASHDELPPLDVSVLEVQAVIVPGELDTERVLIRNVYSEALSLQGWQVSNGSGEIFTFPVLTLFPGGSVSLYSRSGENTALELYWGMSRAVWKSGATVTILDPQGDQRAEYKIP